MIVIIGLLILLGFFWIRAIYREKKVALDYLKTTGRIVGYYNSDPSVEGRGRSITYEYTVDTKVYSRGLHTSMAIPVCEDVDSAPCKGLRFVVIYERGNPGNSLINFNVEGRDSLNYNINTDDFQ
ncbi:hypothetical protein KK062_20030 [Fulvivirgaceae bacterium PWU5]|uniref:DUF3592 domain-containing protein n=1 Tax=Dawidia cretensis TaxID=2782350 RepID=A0AAP2E1X2_9BACT|nr:hypothetical protein [Dawidia cretensis]MBT1710544.1 hypothetical protein [Dawidia cretensis]